MNDTPLSRSFTWRHVSWLTWGLALVALITFLAIASPPSYYYPAMGIGGGVYESAPGAPTGRGGPMMANDTAVSSGPSAGGGTTGSGMMYPYPYPNPSVPSTDTREFLKVSYNAEMLTRGVQALTRRVETTVRGYDGRIDAESSSPKYGYVSFVVPMSKYEAFRTELEGLVGSRFLTVSINSENLLPEKQSIEEQQKQADTALAGYQSARQKLVTAHTSAVGVLQSQIDAATRQLSNLQEETPSAEVTAQIQVVSDNLASLQARLASENNSYTTQLAAADAQIKYGQDWQKAVKTQDQALLDNVATVSGTVSLRWISLWELALLYLPGYWIPGIFAVLTLLSLYRDRRRFRVTI